MTDPRTGGTPVPQSLTFLTPDPRATSQFADTLLPPTGPAQPSSAPGPGPGRYELRGEIARGGMGAVLRGFDQVLGRELALKVMLARHDERPDLLERFLEEARVCGTLQHPGVVPVYDLGEFSDRTPYFTMRLVEGQTLAELLHRRPNSAHDLPRYLKVFEQIAQAIAYAHSVGILHRDLKPANVMVGAFGEVQVMDWGLAKVLASRERKRPEGPPVAYAPGSPPDATRAGTILGTPAFIPPEQARGEIDRLDERCDVFGLGAILCVILTGRPVFMAPDILVKAQNGDLAECFARLDQCDADSDVITLAKQCLAPDVPARPANGKAVADAIGAYLLGVQEKLKQAEVDRAAADARAEEARAKAVAERRARRMTLAMGLAVLLLVVGAGGVTWRVQQQNEAARARRQETDARTKLVLEQSRTLLAEAWKHNDASRLVEARAAADRAAEIAAAGEGSGDALDEVNELRADIASKIEQAEKNRVLLLALPGITLEQEYAPRLTGKDGQTQIHYHKPDAEFESVFRAWGLELGEKELTLEQAAELVQAQPPQVIQEILAGLDEWLLQPRDRGTISQEKLTALADRVDATGLRGAIRRIVADRETEQQQAVHLLSRTLLPLSGPAGLFASAKARRLRELARALDAGAEPPLAVVTLARALRAAGDVWTAERLLRRALARAPQDAALLYEAGVLLSQQRPARLGESIEFFRAARAVNPDQATRLGWMLMHIGHHDEAIDIYRDLLRRHPGHPELHQYMGGMLLHLHQNAEAEANFREATRLDPKSADAHFYLGTALLNQRNRAEAIDSFRMALLGGGRVSRLVIQNHLAVALIGAGKPAEAEPLLRAALKEDLASSETLENLGRVLVELKRPAEAVPILRARIKLRPADPAPHFFLGKALRELKQPEEALACYREAARLDPHMYLGPLGHQYYVLARYTEAVATYRRAVALAPANGYYHNGIGASLFHLGQYDEALASYRQAVTVQPDLALAHANIGEALNRRRQYAEAEKACRRAIELDQKHASAHLWLGNALHGQGHIAEAEEVYRQAIKLNGSSATAHAGLGTVLVKLDRSNEAIPELTRAIELRPRLLDAHLHLVNALLQENQLDEAEAAIRKAGSLFPSEPRVAQLERSLVFWRAHHQKLQDVLNGKVKPASAAEFAELGDECVLQRRYSMAVKMYAEAIQLTPPKDDDADTWNSAGSAAVLAAAGQGKDAAGLPPEERARLRGQGLEWLRKALKGYDAEATGSGTRKEVRERIATWFTATQLASVRDDKALAALPERERLAWRKLWEDAASLRKKLEGNR